jgi:hypothetical protein
VGTPETRKAARPRRAVPAEGTDEGTPRGRASPATGSRLRLSESGDALNGEINPTGPYRSVQPDWGYRRKETVEPLRTPGRHLIPFLVADRRASLAIIRKIPFGHYTGPLGLMSHANTTASFQEAFLRFPCGPALCDTAVREAVPCRRCANLASRVVRIVDSGAFTKEGCPTDYDELFATYDRMGADFGVMIDVLRNSRATLKSARHALATHSSSKHRFKLVGVAQGRSLPEYLECYRGLRDMGFEHVAVGGMLAKRENTAHYAYVRADGRLYDVLSAIRREYPKDWLFALGCYHPKRHLDFERLGVFGSDYKGWIFNYHKRDIRHLHLARLSRYRQVRSFLSRSVYNGPLYLNGSSKIVERARHTGRVLGVVSCSHRKAWSRAGVFGPLRARDAYIGPLFKAGSSYANRFMTDWVILSGKYGLIPQHFNIPQDYNTRLSWRRNSSLVLELRKQILELGLLDFSRVDVVGGSDYVRLVETAYAGTGIPVQSVMSRPTRIGRMIHLLNDAVETGTPLPSPL